MTDSLPTRLLVQVAAGRVVPSRPGAALWLRRRGMNEAAAAEAVTALLASGQLVADGDRVRVPVPPPNPEAEVDRLVWALVPRGGLSWRQVCAYVTLSPREANEALARLCQRGCLVLGRGVYFRGLVRP